MLRNPHLNQLSQRICLFGGPFVNCINRYCNSDAIRSTSSLSSVANQSKRSKSAAVHFSFLFRLMMSMACPSFPSKNLPTQFFQVLCQSANLSFSPVKLSTFTIFCVIAYEIRFMCLVSNCFKIKINFIEFSFVFRFILLILNT